MKIFGKIATVSLLTITAAAAACAVYARKVEEEEKRRKLYSKTDAEETLGGAFAEPTKMLEGVVKKGYRIYKDPSVVEIVYTEKDSELGLVLRLSRELPLADLNNDYNIYNSEKEIEVDGLKVLLYGDDDSVSDILFEKDGISYALLSDLPMSLDAAKEIVLSLN